MYISGSSFWSKSMPRVKLLVKLNCNSVLVFTNHQSPTSISETDETNKTSDTGKTGDTSETGDTGNTGETGKTSDTGNTTTVYYRLEATPE
ncbi:hypothetical protein F8M41_013726 [Gigaspora margarita]|uniref:Uncharacterized protein n=1 Tax=Gigaspora margarita TaxID=4874 RepID=A0A8H3WYA9_GIGMA|nr:hypothetical protein F8M41_013726 [Gigaspora margarita]